MKQLPPLVTRAQALAQQAGFALTREQAGPAARRRARRASAASWLCWRPGEKGGLRAGRRRLEASYGLGC